MRKRNSSGDGQLVGKRVVSFSLLPQITELGTIQEVERFRNGVVYWRVLMDSGMIVNSSCDNFAIYDGPEFKSGDRVRYRVDEGGYWEATVVRPHWVFDHLRYSIRITDGSRSKAKMQTGHEFNAHPK